MKRKYKRRKNIGYKKLTHPNYTAIMKNRTSKIIFYIGLSIYFPGDYGITYTPCFHNFRDKTSTNFEQKCLDNCNCKKRGMCDKYCNCNPSKCDMM